VNEWKALYLKEIKEHRTIFIFLLALTVAAGFVSVISVGWNTETSVVSSTIAGTPSSNSLDWSFHMLWAVVPYLFVFVMPFLLTHSFAQEMKGQTHYLLLSLPVSRSALFLSKVAALVTVAVAIFVLATGATHILYLRLVELINSNLQMSMTRVAPRHLWLLIGEVYFAMLFVFLGAASGVAGVRLVIKRFQGLASAVFVGCAFYLYVRLLPPAQSLLGYVLDSYRIPLTKADSASGQALVLLGDGADSISSGLDIAAYSVLFGTALIGCGVFLFDRRAEA
jgi:ABC-type transport system involved in multi-copper enzyme maturation permease subunit